MVRPTGFRLLVKVAPAEEKTRGGIVIPGGTKAAEDTASQIAEVLAMGDTAYMDAEKFPTGPWCGVGDTILMRSYAGTKIKIDGVDYRIINDDTVEAVIGQDQSRRVERGI